MNNDEKTVEKLNVLGSVFTEKDVSNGEKHEHEESDQSSRGRRYSSTGTGRRG